MIDLVFNANKSLGYGANASVQTLGLLLLVTGGKFVSNEGNAIA